MSVIQLTQGQCAVVDDEDLERISIRRWYAQWNPHTKTFRAICHSVKSDDRYPATLFMHREVIRAPSGLVVDHINHDTLDNRKSNLRLCSVHCNSMNKRILPSKSGFKGVHYLPEGRVKKWSAVICFNRKNMTLGYFMTPEEAAERYDEAAVKYFGEFARTNRMMGLIK